MGTLLLQPPPPKKNWGNARVIVGFYGDNGKLNGNYYLGTQRLSVYWEGQGGLSKEVKKA